jgi:hypothetical protein
MQLTHQKVLITKIFQTKTINFHFFLIFFFDMQEMNSPYMIEQFVFIMNVLHFGMRDKGFSIER